MIRNPQAIRLVIRKAITDTAPLPDDSPRITAGQFGIVISMMESVIRQRPPAILEITPVDVIRKLVFGWLTLPASDVLRPVSARELSPTIKAALWAWAGAERYHDPITGKQGYAARANFHSEFDLVITQALFDWMRTLDAVDTNKPATLRDVAGIS